MISMKRILRSLRGNGRRPDARWRPSLHSLEDRAVPATLSSITSNFNGTAIPAGRDVWFSSVAKVSGVGADPVTLHVTHQTISFTANGTPYTIDVPDTNLTLTPGATSAATSFSGGDWNTSAPSSFSGNVFLGGAVFDNVGGLPGGIKNVVWSAEFSADKAGLSVNWQWAAAVYTNFSTDLNSLNVKPVDSNSLSVYKNSDHSGTPEAFKQFVTGGARGGGGSNYTGSYSSTKSVQPELGEPNSGGTSLSGFVYTDENFNNVRDGVDSGFAGIVVTLTGTDSLGNSVTMSATTDAQGRYTFTGLSAGTYSLSVPLLIGMGYVPANPNVGSLGGVAGFTSIGSITLNDGDQGIDYNFGEQLAG